MPPGLSKAEVSITGNLNAQANLGLYAEASYNKHYEKNLITAAIPVRLRFFFFFFSFFFFCLPSLRLPSFFFSFCSSRSLPQWSPD